MTGDGKVFLDTNLFVYVQDKNEPVKRQRCRDLLTLIVERRCGVISTQVLQELFSVTTSKLRLPPQAAKEIVERLGDFEIVQVSPATITAAMDCVILHRISFWDALIVAAAHSANCRTLYTEDLQPGTVLMGVRIENPLA